MPRFRNTPETFWSRVAIGAAGACWPWLASLDGKGYGQVSYEGRHWRTHRLAWTLTIGPIPDGMTIDPLCRNIVCQNVSHMELVTLSENTRRGNLAKPRLVACRKGHPFTPENTGYAKRGGRFCRACSRTAALRGYHRRRKETADG